MLFIILTMRSLTRIGSAVPRPLVRAVGLVCLADALVGISFGAITTASGLPAWLPVLLSLLVFAGAAQFLFVATVIGGGNPFAGVVAGLLVNVRLVPLGLAVGDLLGPGWLRRVVGAHLVVDETVAFAGAQDRPERRRLAFWMCGAPLFACWNLGALLGALGGRVVADTDALGLDAAFPAVLLGLVVPSLRDGPTRRAALLGGLLALAGSQVLPVGLPVVLSLLALPAASTGLGHRRGPSGASR